MSKRKTPIFVDLHQHCLLSANYSNLSSLGLEQPIINNLNELTFFAKKYINPLYNNIDNISLLIESNFKNCYTSNIQYISTSIDYTLVNYFSSEKQLVEFLKNIQKKFNKLTIFFEIGISRNNFKASHYNQIIELINTGFFKGLDLYGDEQLDVHKKIIKIYKIARKRNMLLKAHIGEFMSGRKVKQLYEMLHLNEIQHGISISTDRKLLKYFSKQNVVFNISPTSNKILKNIDYNKCVAKIFYVNNIKFTLSSDDFLFFHKTVADEYYNLQKYNILTTEELKKINNFSICYFKKNYLKKK